MSSLAGPLSSLRFFLPGLPVSTLGPGARRCLATGTRICDLLAGAARLELPRLLVGWLCRVTRVLVPGEIRSEPGDGLGTDVRARGVRDAIRQLF